MAEIRLICPDCGAAFVLPRDAIPAAGREVECSSCGNVWQAQRPAQAAPPLDLGSYTLPRDEAPAPATVLPPVSRRLAPDVLDILRDEVEHERRLREAEAPATETPDDPVSEDGEWPATTVVLPAGAARAVTPTPQPLIPALAPASAPPAEVTPPPTTPLLRQQAAAPAARPVSAETKVQAPARRPNRGYRAGFGLSVLL
ncbi:MAG: hypothetical protein FJX25_16305, partial [Alphaproteobacteria bacterium]|nr:hypothetical protein [Alphaproteobacteria bacterium]